MKALELILFGDFEKSHLIDLNNNNLLTHVSLSLFAFKSCQDSLLQLINLITRLDSFEQELNQIFLLLETNSFKGYFNLGKDKTSSNSSFVTLNQLISIDFVLYATSQLLSDAKNANIDLKYADILWKILIESYYFSLALQSNIDHSIASDFDSFSNRETISMVKINTHKRHFKSVYSNLNEMANENVPKSKSNDVLDSDELNCNKQFLQQQRLIVFKILFLFLNKNASKDSISLINLSKLSLIDCLANNINEYIFDTQFAIIDSRLHAQDSLLKTDSFQFIWQICSYSCDFSKRMLFEINLRKQTEYFTFNNLIIDKIEEYLVKLINRYFVRDIVKTPDQEFVMSPFLLSDSTCTMSSFSVYTMLVNEIWIHIFIDYFFKIFSKCGINPKAKVCFNEEDQTKNCAKKTPRESLSLLIKNSKLKLHTLNSKNNASGDSAKNKKSNRKKSLNENFVIDLSICKKLVCLLQKLFELYNLNFSNVNAIPFYKKPEELTPSTSRSSISSTPTLNETNSVIYNDLLEKLEASTLRSLNMNKNVF